VGSRAEEVEEKELKSFYRLCPSFSQIFGKRNMRSQTLSMKCSVEPNDGLAFISLSILIIDLVFANQLK
jgi:hypothetical protein